MTTFGASKEKATQPARLKAQPITEAASRCLDSAKKSTPAKMKARVRHAVDALRGEKPATGHDFSALVESFKTREFPGFKAWMEKRLHKNSPAVLAPNPANHVFDSEESSLDLAVGTRDAARRIQHQKNIPPAYILKQGPFREVLESVSSLPHEQQLEAAMAFLVEHKKGDLLDNAPEYKQFEKTMGQELRTATGRTPEGLDNPLYRGVCEAVLDLFKENGWVKKGQRAASRRD
jgi:hypothetical protein